MRNPGERRRPDAPATARLAGLLLAVAPLVACESGAGPEDILADCLAAAEVAGPAVGIRGFAFLPDTVRVTAGEAVTWVNCEDEGVDAHTATSDENAWGSDFLFPGDAFTRTFDATGAHPYHCGPHPFMRGVVIVEEEA